MDKATERDCGKVLKALSPKDANHGFVNLIYLAAATDIGTPRIIYLIEQIRENMIKFQNPTGQFFIIDWEDRTYSVCGEWECLLAELKHNQKKRDHLAKVEKQLKKMLANNPKTPREVKLKLSSYGVNGKK